MGVGRLGRVWDGRSWAGFLKLAQFLPLGMRGEQRQPFPKSSVVEQMRGYNCDHGCHSDTSYHQLVHPWLRTRPPQGPNIHPFSLSCSHLSLRTTAALTLYPLSHLSCAHPVTTWCVSLKQPPSLENASGDRNIHSRVTVPVITAKTSHFVESTDNSWLYLSNFRVVFLGLIKWSVHPEKKKEHTAHCF